MRTANLTRATTPRAPMSGHSAVMGATLKRHWAPLGLAVFAGAALRLIWINDASFLGDQAELLAIGRSAADHHALIVTGTLSSLTAINLPMSAWLYAPFAPLGGPIVATVFTALLNLLAVAILYALGARYGGRRAGFVAAMLYATASAPVHFSRFIWEPNLMAPFIVLLLGAVLAGLVGRRKGWLGWAALFWAIALQLHLTAGVLVAVIAFALLFTWRDLRRRDVLWAGAVLTILFAPVLLWELVSQGYDLTVYRSLESLKPQIDAAALVFYAKAISPASPDLYGPGSSYAAVGQALLALGPVMQALAFASGVWLFAVTAHPWMSGRRAPGGPRAIMATPRWRIAALLFIWQVLPVLLMLRHTVGVQEHYLLMLLPIVYLTIGLWASAASRAIEAWLARRRNRWAPIAPIGLAAITLTLAIAQTAGVGAELLTVHSGQFSATAWPLNYGIPLSSEDATLAASRRLAAQENAALYIASTLQQQEAYAYLGLSGAPKATVYVSDDCLILPARGSARPTVTLALPETIASSALPTLMGVKRLGALQAQGSAPLALYLSQPGSGPRQETALPPAVTSASPRPTAYSYTRGVAGQTYLTLRWSSPADLRENPAQRASYWFGATPDGPLVASYSITAQRIGSDGQPAGAPQTATCGRAPWQSGMDLLAWLPLPSGAPAGLTAWSVTLSAALTYAARPSIGPVALETGVVGFTQPRVIAGPLRIETR